MITIQQNLSRLTCCLSYNRNAYSVAVWFVVSTEGVRHLLAGRYKRCRYECLNSSALCAVLQILGDYEKVIMKWPCILSLIFLLGRFIYILVKDIRVHLQLEQEVSIPE